MKYITLLLTLLWFLLSTYLSHQTGEATAATSQHLARMLGRETWNPLLRKAAHVVVFFVLSLLLFVTVEAWEGNMGWMGVVVVWCFVDEATKPLIGHIGARHRYEDVTRFKTGDVAYQLYLNCSFEKTVMSKYVQSDAYSSYSEVTDYLQNDKKVRGVIYS